MKNKKFDIVIIGSGIIGGAIAYKLSLSGNFRIAVIDKESGPNKHQTGRNSGVIHSGVYYAKDSLKSKNCLSGYRQLLPFLRDFEIDYKITGKLIAAADESEHAELDRLYQNAVKIGLDVEYLDEVQIKNIDKNLVCKNGFYVRETGITDYKEVLLKFIEISKKNGVEYIYDSKLKKVKENQDSILIQAGNHLIESGYLLNCAGLQSDRVFTTSTGLKSPVTIIPFKGEYFKIPKNSYESDIPIYPVPNPDFPFLGVHLTRMIDGTLKVGPNAVLSFSREGYNGFEINLSDTFKNFSNTTLPNIAKKYKSVVVKELLKHGSKSYFETNVKKYWSKFSSDMITGYTSGIRAQATENGKLLSDFKIESVNKQVHVLNAPSPAATSCMAIADTVIEEFEKIIN